jgi:hypothetical protein
MVALAFPIASLCSCVVQSAAHDGQVLDRYEQDSGIRALRLIVGLGALVHTLGYVQRNAVRLGAWLKPSLKYGAMLDARQVQG